MMMSCSAFLFSGVESQMPHLFVLRTICIGALLHFRTKTMRCVTRKWIETAHRYFSLLLFDKSFHKKIFGLEELETCPRSALFFSQRTPGTARMAIHYLLATLLGHVAKKGIGPVSSFLLLFSSWGCFRTNSFALEEKGIRLRGFSTSRLT
jgi:hypothetical protein